jgi:hypothetical protein
MAKTLEHLAGVQSLDGSDLRHGNAFPFTFENNNSYESATRFSAVEWRVIP